MYMLVLLFVLAGITFKHGVVLGSIAVWRNFFIRFIAPLQQICTCHSHSHSQRQRQAAAAKRC